MTQINTYVPIEELAIDTDAIAEHERQRASAATDLDAAEQALEDAEQEVSAIRKRAASGGTTSPQSLVNAEAAVTLAKDGVKGARTRAKRLASKDLGVTDLDFIRALAVELAPVLDGLVPIFYGLGKAPKELPEGFSAPAIIVTQSKNSQIESGLSSADSLLGEVEMRYFHSPIHIPLSKELLDKQVGPDVRMTVRNVRQRSTGSEASIKAALYPLYPYIHARAIEGDKSDKASCTEPIYKVAGKRFGLTDGKSPYENYARVKPVEWVVKPYTEILSANVDADGIQTVTAQIESGWWMGEPLDWYNQIDRKYFPEVVDNCGDRLIGEVDATLGRITAVESIDCQPLSANTYGITLTVTAQGILK